MFEETQRFKPNDRWGHLLEDKGGKNPPLRFLRYDEGPWRVIFEAEIFADIIMAEYCLREIVQREQMLTSKTRTSQMIRAHRNWDEAEYKLYLAEVKLPPGAIYDSYHSLWKDAEWYLRQELVDLFASRGGCCSRNCGCCKTRYDRTAGHTDIGHTRHKGIGHCTPSCECCTTEREIEYDTYDINYFVEDLKKQLLGDNPAYIVHMAEAFFLLPLVDKAKEAVEDLDCCLEASSFLSLVERAKQLVDDWDCCSVASSYC
ncbi:unnamed protein product [Penicillium salamii]|nr:unnamed protein product [Penicillium salamii]CAG8225313.1 unnamed protein product [Penicillium salamii]